MAELLYRQLTQIPTVSGASIYETEDGNFGVSVSSQPLGGRSSTMMVGPVGRFGFIPQSRMLVVCVVNLADHKWGPEAALRVLSSILSMAVTISIMLSMKQNIKAAPRAIHLVV